MKPRLDILLYEISSPLLRHFPDFHLQTECRSPGSKYLVTHNALHHLYGAQEGARDGLRCTTYSDAVKTNLLDGQAPCTVFLRGIDTITLPLIRFMDAVRYRLGRGQVDTIVVLIHHERQILLEWAEFVLQGDCATVSFVTGDGPVRQGPLITHVPAPITAHMITQLVTVKLKDWLVGEQNLLGQAILVFMPSSSMCQKVAEVFVDSYRCIFYHDVQKAGSRWSIPMEEEEDHLPWLILGTDEMDEALDSHLLMEKVRHVIDCGLRYTLDVSSGAREYRLRPTASCTTHARTAIAGTVNPEAFSMVHRLTPPEVERPVIEMKCMPWVASLSLEVDQAKTLPTFQETIEWTRYVTAHSLPVPVRRVVTTLHVTPELASIMVNSPVEAHGWLLAAVIQTRDIVDAAKPLVEHAQKMYQDVRRHKKMPSVVYQQLKRWCEMSGKEMEILLRSTATRRWKDPTDVVARAFAANICRHLHHEFWVSLSDGCTVRTFLTLSTEYMMYTRRSQFAVDGAIPAEGLRVQVETFREVLEVRNLPQLRQALRQDEERFWKRGMSINMLNDVHPLLVVHGLENLRDQHLAFMREWLMEKRAVAREWPCMSVLRFPADSLTCTGVVMASGGIITDVVVAGGAASALNIQCMNSATDAILRQFACKRLPRHNHVVIFASREDVTKAKEALRAIRIHVTEHHFLKSPELPSVPFVRPSVVLVLDWAVSKSLGRAVIRAPLSTWSSKKPAEWDVTDGGSHPWGSGTTVHSVYHVPTDLDEMDIAELLQIPSSSIAVKRSAQPRAIVHLNPSVISQFLVELRESFGRSLPLPFHETMVQWSNRRGIQIILPQESLLDVLRTTGNSLPLSYQDQRIRAHIVFRVEHNLPLRVLGAFPTELMASTQVTFPVTLQDRQTPGALDAVEAALKAQRETVEQMLPRLHSDPSLTFLNTKKGYDLGTACLREGYRDMVVDKLWPEGSTILVYGGDAEKKESVVQALLTRARSFPLPDDDEGPACIICASGTPANYTLQGCGCKFCSSCLSRWITTQCADQSLVTIVCPSFECQKPIVWMDVECLGEYAIVGQYQRNRVHQLAMRSIEMVAFCPNDCGSLTRYDDRKAFDCPRCKTDFCLRCSQEKGTPQPGHRGPCEVANGQESEVEQGTEEAVRATGAHRCPVCRAPVLKDGGCSHMTCTAKGCGVDFCWLCMNAFSRLDNTTDSASAIVTATDPYQERVQVSIIKETWVTKDRIPPPKNPFYLQRRLIVLDTGKCEIGQTVRVQTHYALHIEECGKANYCWQCHTQFSGHADSKHATGTVELADKHKLIVRVDPLQWSTPDHVDAPSGLLHLLRTQVTDTSSDEVDVNHTVRFSTAYEAHARECAWRTFCWDCRVLFSDRTSSRAASAVVVAVDRETQTCQVEIDSSTWKTLDAVTPPPQGTKIWIRAHPNLTPEIGMTIKVATSYHAHLQQCASGH